MKSMISARGILVGPALLSTTILAVAAYAAPAKVPVFPAPAPSRISVMSSAFGPRPTAAQSQMNAVTCTAYVPASTAAPAEIVELARALKYDPALIFQYVHDNIEFDPIWGSMKGALGTLLDGRGGAFDQASLLVALLNQASIHNTAISNVQFQQGTITPTLAQVAAWLRTDMDVGSIGNVLGSGGYATLSNNGSTLTVPHVWVQAVVAGQTVSFDPAFKQYASVAGINLASAMGYTQQKFLSDLETSSVSGPASLQLQQPGPFYAAIDLNGYSSNLATYIRTNYPTADLKTIIGGGSITPTNIASFANFAPISPSVAQSYTAIPNALRASLSVVVQGATCEQFYSSDIYGQRLSIVAPASGAPSLDVNGSAVQTSGSSFAAGSPISVSESVAGPWPGGFNQNNGVFGGSRPAQTVNAGSLYVVMNGWDQVGRGTIEKHQRILAQNAATGQATDEAVLGESLTIIGYNWLSQIAQRQRIADELQGLKNEYIYGVGIVGQAVGPTTTGPYVDLPVNLVNSPVRTNGSGSNAVARSQTAFFDDGGVASGFEAGVLRQGSATGAENLIASTTAIIYQAILAGLPIYDLNTSNFSTYSGNLGWSSANLATLQGAVQAGYRSIAPAAPSGGTFAFGSWKGVGFKGLYASGNAASDLEQISGGLSGGFSGSQIPASLLNGTYTDANSFAIPSSLDTSGSDFLKNSDFGSSGNTVGDPIDRQSGAFTYSHDDITTGSRPFPYGLGFTRIYSSGAAPVAGQFGKGWTHNYAYSVSNISDGFDAMGGSSAAAAAAVIAHSYVSNDLLSAGAAAPLPNVAGAVLTNWRLIDQLVLNVEAVSKPDGIEHFVSVPNIGSVPPVGSVAALTQSGSKFTYQGKDGITLTFDGNIDTKSSSSGITHITNWSNASGASVNLTYDSGTGYLTDVKNNFNRELKFSNGYVGLGVSDVPTQGATAHSVSYGYNADGSTTNLTSFTDAANQTTNYKYDVGGTYYAAVNHMTQIFYPSGVVNGVANPFLTNTYDSLGRVMQQADGRGKATQAFIAGSRSEIVNPIGVRHAWYMDPAGRVTSEIQDVGDSTHLNLTSTTVYDGQGNPTLATRPEGDAVQIAYDGLFNPLSITKLPVPGSAEGQAGTTLPTILTYEKPVASLPLFEEVLTSKDPNLNVTTYHHYTTNGLVSEIDQPAVTKPGVTGTVIPKQFLTYTSLGLPQDVTDAEGRDTHTDYDPNDLANATAVTLDYKGLKLATHYVFDGWGNRTSAQDPNGYVTGYNFDALRRQTVAAIDSSGKNGFPDIITDTTYDSEGRTTSIQRYVGGTAITSCQNTQTNYEITAKVYDLAGNLSTTTDPRCNTVTDQYDDAERLFTTTDGEKRVRQYSYDAADRLTAILDATPQGTGATIEAHQWFPDGEQQSFTDPNTNKTGYAYDGFVRLKQTTYPDASTEQFAYDADGNLKTKTTRNTAKTITRSYDALNRVLTKAATGELTVTYGYDETGLPLQVSDSNGTFQLGYDSAGRKTSETKVANGRGVVRLPDAAGNLKTLTWQDGYALGFGYDAANRLKTVTETSTGTVLGTYGYDNLSRRRSLAYGNGASAAYGYDNADNLTTLSQNFVSGNSNVTFTIGYNNDNQRSSAASTRGAFVALPAASSTGYGVNALNQYTAIGSVAPTYNINGSLLKDGTFTYNYDTETRLISANSSAHALTFTYDAMGRLGTVTTDGTAVSYDYDGVQPTGDWGGTGFATGQSIQRRHVFGPGGEPLYRIAGGAASYSHQDALGSTIALSDGSGAVLAKYAYDAFGVPSVPLSTVFGYGGQREELTTGLVYDRARFYSPAQGRFLQVDPSGYAGGANLYAYVGNDPINLVDPTGLYGQLASDAANYALTHPGQVAGGVLLGAAAGACALAEPCGLVAAGVGTAGAATATITTEGALLAGGTIMMVAPPVYIDPSKYPESAQHIQDAQDAGAPDELTIDRSGAAANRADALAGTDPVSGLDRDEYPPAVTAEGGSGASVRPISPSDNRGAGAAFGNQIRGLPNGTTIQVIVGPRP